MINKSVITVDAYILAQPKATQDILNQLRSLVKRLAPKGEEKMSYGMPTFKMKRNLVHFAAYPHHIGFYPAPSGILAFQKELAGYKQGKGSVQFPLDEPIPYSLIEKIVRYRVREES